MAASRQTPEVKQVCDRIMQWAIEKFTGSGNPEVDDAVDCCLMLTQIMVFVCDSMCIKHKV